MSPFCPDIALQLQSEIIRKRRLGLGKIILEAIIILYEQKVTLAIKRIAAKSRELLGIESEFELSARKVGAIIDKDLKLKKVRKRDGNNAPITVIWELKRILKLCKKYGIEFNDLTSLTSEKGENKPKTTESSIEGFIPLDSEEPDSKKSVDEKTDTEEDHSSPTGR